MVSWAVTCTKDPNSVRKADMQLHLAQTCPQNITTQFPHPILQVLKQTMLNWMVAATGPRNSDPGRKRFLNTFFETYTIAAIHELLLDRLRHSRMQLSKPPARLCSFAPEHRHDCYITFPGLPEPKKKKPHATSLCTKKPHAALHNLSIEQKPRLMAVAQASPRVGKHYSWSRTLPVVPVLHHAQECAYPPGGPWRQVHQKCEVELATKFNTFINSLLKPTFLGLPLPRPEKEKQQYGIKAKVHNALWNFVEVSLESANTPLPPPL
ncbi:hypothetical protein DFH08DRAFT_1029163 [Mycena albidolilacea]|uniref:Uncharacterized protein n=1 Tax=Mycena albidolilacea TaxID=1033008 RepID=A0AAD7EI68_9AGAR|nr:hypothetical protein DFH08DRAFT_1029163 [Mycena albidolilacea]